MKCTLPRERTVFPGYVNDGLQGELLFITHILQDPCMIFLPTFGCFFFNGKLVGKNQPMVPWETVMGLKKGVEMSAREYVSTIG